MIVIEEYVDPRGASPFGKWFVALDAQAAAMVVARLTRLAEGNTSNLKALSEGVCELKIDRGPGYRIYFAWDGKTLVILLGGGTKKRQNADIKTAIRHWHGYKEMKLRKV